MKVLVIGIVHPSGVSVNTDKDGVTFCTFSEREPSWYTVLLSTYVEVPNDCLSAAVPQRHEIPTLMHRSSRRYKNQHAFPRPVPKKQHPHKGR